MYIIPVGMIKCLLLLWFSRCVLRSSAYVGICIGPVVLRSVRCVYVE